MTWDRHSSTLSSNIDSGNEFECYQCLWRASWPNWYRVWCYRNTNFYFDNKNYISGNLSNNCNTSKFTLEANFRLPKYETGVINVYQVLKQSPLILGCLHLGTMADEKRNRGLIVAISTFLVQYVIGWGLIEVNRSSNFSNTVTRPAYQLIQHSIIV